MKTRMAIALLLPFALSGCLEVNQHPGWKKGEYAGKPDNRPFQKHFHNERLSWLAAIMNRNANQNEYNRANP